MLLSYSKFALRPSPSSLAVRALSISSPSHLSAFLHGNTHRLTASGCRRFASLKVESESTANDSVLNKFFKSAKLLNATVEKQYLAMIEPLMQSLDELDASSDDGDKKQVLSSLEALLNLNDSGLKNSSLRLALTRSIADFYQQKLQQPELAVTNYLEALEVLSSLSAEDMNVHDCLQVELLSNVVKCYNKLGREVDADAYFQKTIAAHEQHRQRCGLSTASDVDAALHKKLDYEVLDLQLGFMEHLLTATCWDEVSALLERVVEQLEDSQQLSSLDKLAQIQIIISKSVDWLAAAEKTKPRRRKINKLSGLDAEDGVKVLQREMTLLDELAKKCKSDKDEKEVMKEMVSTYNLLKAEVPNGCGTCTTALMIASKRFTEAQYSSALTYYLEALDILASTPSDHIRREWNMAWVECQVMHIGALCAVSGCYQKLNDHNRANQYFVQARDAYNSVCNRVRIRGPSHPLFVDDRALCASTDDEDRLLSGLSLTVASTLVDYAENLAAQKNWASAKESTDRALELAQGCTISLNHIKARVDRIMKSSSFNSVILK